MAYMSWAREESCSDKALKENNAQNGELAPIMWGTWCPAHMFPRDEPTCHRLPSLGCSVSAWLDPLFHEIPLYTLCVSAYSGKIMPDVPKLCWFFNSNPDMKEGHGKRRLLAVPLWGHWGRRNQGRGLESGSPDPWRAQDSFWGSILSLVIWWYSQEYFWFSFYSKVWETYKFSGWQWNIGRNPTFIDLLLNVNHWPASFYTHNLIYSPQ